jgi:biopolymer transport protein ExbD
VSGCRYQVSGISFQIKALNIFTNYYKNLMNEVTLKTKTKEPEKSTGHKVAVRPLKLWQDISSPQEVQVNIVPLIDVIFCILTFFILAAVGFSRQQAINLNLPKASTGTAQMREMLVVSLDEMGQLYLEKQPVSQVQLYSALKNYHSLNPTGLMVLHASKDVTYNQVVEVLDILKEVGGDRVALATLAGKSQTSTENTNTPSGVNPYYQPNSGVNSNSPVTPNTPNPPRVPGLPPNPSSN